MTSAEFSIRDAGTADIPAIQDLILNEGPNEWNHLPPDEVRAHVEGIQDNTVFAVVADQRGQFIGVVTYTIGKRYPQYQPPGREDQEHGYLAEAVTHHEHSGRGIGSKLLREAIQIMFARGIREVYAMRHADNGPSGGMMKKAGMSVVDEFDDPDIRPTGSRRTTVTRIINEQ